MTPSKSGLRLPPEVAFSEGDELIPGLVLSPGIVAMHKAEVLEAAGNSDLMPPDPHAPGQLVAFIDWLAQVSPASTSGLPRYMEALYNERPDLQRAMPDVPEGGLVGIAWWSYLYGRFEVPNFRVLGHNVDVKPKNQLGDELIPGLVLSPGIVAMHKAEVLEAAGNSDLMPPDPYAPGQLVAFIDWLAQVSPVSTSGLPRYMEALYNERPELQGAMPEVKSGELARFAWWAYARGRREVSNFRVLGHAVSIRRRLAEAGRVSNGVDAIGFFNAEHGIGEAARLLVEALRALEVPVSTIGYRNTESRQRAQFETDEVGRYKTVIAAVNAELNRSVRELFGDFFFRNTYVIGQWFWELEVAPDWYEDAYQYVDELWAPTKFIEEMLRNEAPERVVVHHMPLPLRKPKVVDDVSRAELGLDGRYMFLFTFDFMSVMKRKNPLGLVEAFKKAFAPGEGPMLVLKCINGETRPEGFAELVAATEAREDIIVMNKYLDSHQSAALMNLCDCYVSLHRSEGLGLTIAEAMLLGKPVIATGYSGNLDFMTSDTSYMVPWTRVKVGQGAEAYSPDATWAEPDLAVAAQLMREVFENPVKAAEIALAGKTDLETRFTPERTGAKMRVRLEQLWEAENGK